MKYGLESTIRRQRRSLQAVAMTAPAGFVCPHCGRRASEPKAEAPKLETGTETVLADGHQSAPVAPVVEQVKVSTPKKSREDAPKH